MALAASYRNAAKYRQSQTETSSPTHLVVMLYDGAIRFLTIARGKMSSGDIEARHTNLLKGQRIISELLGSLDMARGGEVAANLQRIYMYMLRQLVEANLYDRAEPIDVVVRQLRSLRESWVEIDKTQAGTPIALDASIDA